MVPWKGVKMELHPVADSGKNLPEYMTPGPRLDCALRMRKSLQTNRAGSPTLNGVGHDRAEKLQDNNAGGTERQGGEEPKTKTICTSSVCHTKHPGPAILASLEKLSRIMTSSD